MRGWRFRTLGGEAVRNLTAASARTLVFFFATAAVVGSLTWSELDTTTELVDFERDFIHRGGRVAVATSDGGLPASRCHLLSQRSEIVQAGGLRTGEVVEITSAPGTKIQTGQVTAGAINLWSDPSSSSGEFSGGLVLGIDIASELGLGVGRMIAFDGAQPQRVAAVVDPEERNPRVAGWLLSPVPAVGTVDQCWVEFIAGALGAGVDVLDVVFADTGTSLRVAPWIQLDEFSRDPSAEFARRVQARAWLPAAFILTLLFWLSAWFRRSEVGLYRAVGTTGAGVWLVGQLEALIVVVVATASGFLWAGSIHVAQAADFPTGDQMFIAFRTSASASLLALALAPFGWLWLGRGVIATQLKDR